MAAWLSKQMHRCSHWVFHQLDGHGAGRERTLFKVLSYSWRTLRRLYHRWLKAQPMVMLVLDAPPVLSGFASISGWVVGKKAPVINLQAWVDGQMIEEVVPDEPRPDVADQFPYLLSKGTAGFRLTPDPQVLADGTHRLRIEVVDAMGNTNYLDTDLIVMNYLERDSRWFPIHLRGSDREYHAIQQRPVTPSVQPRSNKLHPEVKISIVMPVYRPHLPWLKQAIESVSSQSNPDWELCICDDGSSSLELHSFLTAVAHQDSRIKVIHLDSNQGIAQASNAAIRLSTGDYIAFMDQDDLLSPNAIQEIGDALQKHDFDFLYTDEDRIDAQGTFVQPFFKPAFSLELLRSFMYLAHLCVIKRTFLNQIGMLRSSFDGCQDWELALRAAKHSKNIYHLPRILYHWRMGGHSAQSDFNQLCHHRARQAIQASMSHDVKSGTLIDGPIGCTFHRRYPVAKPEPLVSLLIPTNHRPDLLQSCLRSIRKFTAYPNYEVIVLDNSQLQSPSKRSMLRWGADRVLHLPIPFNHSRLNRYGANVARGTLLLFLNDDIEATHAEWLSLLVEQACRPRIGAVGAHLLYPNGQTQHAGIITHPDTIARNLNAALLRDGIDRGMIRMQRPVAAVTGACLLTHKRLFLEAGGFDDIHLPTSFNDVDYCLQLRSMGYQIMYQPLAQLIHHETASRLIDPHIDQQAKMWMRAQWGTQGLVDPYWNPNLTHGEPLGFCFNWCVNSVGARLGEELATNSIRSQFYGTAC